jgi:thioesterase domain-containing protein/acyl carrier protein
VRAGGPIPAPVPIGRPVSNTRVYVLDRNLQPVPAGVAGELHIGGDGLAQGYLNAPDLTLEKFIPDPFSDDVAALLYKSGDRARHLADGTIEFLGRLDRQVKVRGFRVEPAEVEAALSEYAGVREVAVVVHEGDAGDQRLIAYLVAAAGAPPSFVEELRCFAKGRLPKYLVPSAFLLVDSIPLTAHGKIERGALPAAAVAAGSPSASPPTTKVEWRLAGIWSELLGVSSPGVHDDFFDLGGHSLLATRLVSRVREAFGVSLPLRQLFENPTIASLAALIGVESGAEAQAPPRAPVSSLLLIPVQPDGTRVPFFLVPGGGGGERELINYAPLLRSLGTDQPCYGFNADAVNVPAEGESVEGLARALVWEIRALQPEGPYLLGGECVGGIVAFEAARQLRAAGQRVGLLVLLDTEMPNLSVSLRYRVSSAHQSVFGRARWYFNDLSRLDIAGWTPYALDKSRKAWARVRSAIGRKDSEGAADPLTRRQSSGQSYAETLLRYRPRPYDGAITLLISEDLYSRGSVQAWSEVASGGAEVHVVPGDHTTYLRDHVRVLAERLGACLDRAQPDTWSRAGAPARLSQSAGG